MWHLSGLEERCNRRTLKALTFCSVIEELVLAIVCSVDEGALLLPRKGYLPFRLSLPKL